MDELISPRYQIKLLNEVKDAIWNQFGSYEQVRFYIDKWYKNNYEPNGFNNDYEENFKIIEKGAGKIDLMATLNSMDGTTLLKVAIDLGVDTPDFIPSIPTFKNEIKAEIATAYDTFSKALKHIETDPALAIGLANSALESIIKEILKDERISSKIAGKETLYKLAVIILKEFNLIEDNPKETKTIGNSLLTISQCVETLRSEKTNFHGKTNEDYVIEDSIYAYLVVNSVTTVGLFLNSYYKSKYPKVKEVETTFKTDDLPF